MLLEKINEDLKEAMKSKDKEKLETIRLIKTALMNEKIKLMVENLSEEQEISVLAKEVKQRKDSISEFDKAGREDLSVKEKVQLSILETYLPKQLTEDELKEIILDVIKTVNATSSKDMGKVMGALTSKVKGRADMKEVNRLVKEILV